jgi:hypothetical protein
VITHEQKKLLFDYCFGLTNKNDTKQAEKLIFHSKEASSIRSHIKAALAPLSSLEAVPCPDYLAEKVLSTCCRNIRLISRTHFSVIMGR